MERPAVLNEKFCKAIDRPGRYGDRRGGYGLSLLVRETKTGRLSKSWSQRLRFDGEPFNIGLGSYPLMTLAKAREKAFDNAREVAGGTDIREEKRQRRMIPTFAEAAEEAVKTTRWTLRTQKNNFQVFDLYLRPGLGKDRVDRITSPDVIAVLKPIWTEKSGQALKARQMLNLVFKWAKSNGYINSNPADGIDAALGKQAPHEHHKALPWKDVPAEIMSLRSSELTTTFKPAIEFLVLTAARLGEVLGASWEEIDIDAETWTVPAERMKANNLHTVPLSKAAMAIINRAFEETGGTGLIFQRNSGYKIWDSTLRAELRSSGKTYTLHGFRSTFRDWCAENGVDRELAEMSLAHKIGNVVENAYKRTELVERRRPIMEQWGQFVTGGVV